MKKSLVLALALAMGVTASAYAANPFSDVPAGHWAYDAVDKLAAAGVIDGMGNGQFDGDRTMTRYEMAQIVAKAMAKGANVEKLAAEFAEELDQLGVRVAKLEKKQDNVKIAGKIYGRLWSYNGSAKKEYNGSSHYTLRTDLFLAGQVNEDWTYNARLRNDQDFNTAAGDNDVALKDAYVEGKLGGVNVIAGRYNVYLEDGNIYDERGDMIILSYGKDVKATVGYGQYDLATGGDTNSKFAYGLVEGSIGVVNAHVGYYMFKDVKVIDNDSKILAIGVGLPVVKDLQFTGTYFNSGTEENKADNYTMGQSGFTLGLDYKGAEMDKPGSYGLYARYYSLPKSVAILHTMDAFNPLTDVDEKNSIEYDGFRGTLIGGKVTLAKNIQWNLDYYALQGKQSGRHFDTIYSALTFAF